MKRGKSRVNCSVFGCMRKRSDGDGTLSFFKLPRDCEQRNEWLRRIGRPDLLNKTDLKPDSYVVCSIHFEDSMKCSPQITQKLLLGALPTKYLGDPQPSTSQYENVSENMKFSASSEVSTQTKDSMGSCVNMLSIDRIKNASKTISGTQTENPVKEHITQTSITLSTNTPSEKKLCVQLQEAERERKRLQHELDKMKREIESKNSLSLVSSDDEDDETSKRFYKLVKWLNNVRNRYSKDNRYDAEFKFFALNLHYSSPQTYRSLKRILNLPSEITLSRFKLHIHPEIDDKILNTIALKIKSLPDKAKYCTICVDEMVLKSNLYYDIKHDEIYGLHNINGNVTKEIVSNAYVIMLRGIAINWKQPVGYTLLASTQHYQELDEWMNEVISKLLEVGIKVMAIVSDQGSNFDKYAKEIKHVTQEKPYFDFNGSKIYYIFDVPHMLKCVRDNLLMNDFYLNGQKISWEYIKNMYIHQKEQNLGLIPKISEAHINPNNFQKMRVKYAAQIFSQTVYGALNTFIYAKLLPEDARPTADFIKTMNDLFDVLNSSKIKSSYRYQQALSLNGDQIDVLEKAKTMFQKITAKNQKTGSDSTTRIKTFIHFRITIQSIMMLCNDLKQEGLAFMFTQRLNQDPLKNFFGSVRQQGGNYREPTAIQFTRAFSKLFVCNMLTNSSVTNCGNDLCDLLLKAKNMILKDRKQQNASKRTSSPVALDGDVDYRFDLPTKDAITYVSAYLLFKCSQKHQCSEFDTYLKHSPELKNTTMFTHFKAFNTQSSFYGRLKVPHDSFVSYVKHLETIFSSNFDEVMTNHPGAALLALLKNVSFNAPCTCFPTLYLLKHFIRFRIFSTIKFNNRQFKYGKKNKTYFIKIQQL